MSRDSTSLTSHSTFCSANGGSEVFMTSTAPSSPSLVSSSSWQDPSKIRITFDSQNKTSQSVRARPRLLFIMCTANDERRLEKQKEMSVILSAAKKVTRQKRTSDKWLDWRWRPPSENYVFSTTILYFLASAKYDFRTECSHFQSTTTRALYQASEQPISLGSFKC